MKKYWNAACCALTLAAVMAASFFPACFESLQRTDDSSLLLGFPFSFYHVQVPAEGVFAVHLNLAALAGNLLLVYAAIYGIFRLSKHIHHG